MAEIEHPHAAVSAFHRAMGLGIAAAPELPTNEALRSLRRSLLAEEYQEYVEAEAADDLVEIADALADIVYVAFGTALEYGIPLDRVLAEVHRSNMSKLDPSTGQPNRREDGKILKPATFSRPDILGILGNRGDK